MRIRLITAMAVYALLAVLAALTLDWWQLRVAVWVLLGGFAVKTWIASKMHDSE